MDLTAVLPEIIMIIFAAVLPAVYLGTKNDKMVAGISIAGILIAMATVGQFLWNGASPVVFENLLQLDAFSALFMLVFLIVALYVVIASVRYIEKERHLAEYYTLIMFATVGMMVVASATDLITLFVGIELTSLSSFALVGFRKKDKRGAEAATKYFVIGGLSSAISLYGISLLYGVTHTTNIAEIGAVVGDITGLGPALYISLVMLIAGFGFKVAIVPFHMWAPDVYEGAPTPIASFLAAGSKKMGLVALFKIFLIGLFAIKADWEIAVAVIAIATMTLGNIMAVNQTSIKRMLAYSSIAQAGYILIVLPIGTDYALMGGIFHIITHAFMKGGAFLIVAGLSMSALGENIADYKGLAKRTPLLALGMAILLFALAGIPPLSGFASKVVLFSSAVDASMIPADNWMIWLAIAGVLNSALSLYYYARVVKYMYVEKGPESKIRIPTTVAIAIFICVVATVIIGIYPEPIVDACQAAATAFFA
ncbi:MAG: NADH-quinone oxidoreductase subunit N [Methanomassiliicoccales archaeon]|nr:NADH-quinone oxidoreductase subunit N [Methanomassiliicoccales archaeon]NYT15058.1 NADH-quinone oxidoreductase subunit N [Methanomassiliicoccales archaeon]